MQNKADVVGRPIEVPGFDEAVPLGAAILAGLGVGLYPSEQAAMDRVWKPGRRFEPDLKLTALYAESFPKFEGLYPALKDFNLRLHS
jgi:sugar (pentulose or hexulose) kinase